MIIIYIFEYSPAGFLHDRDDRIVRRDRDRKPAWAFHTAGKDAVNLRMSFAKCLAECLSFHVLEKQPMNSDDKTSKSKID